MNVNTLLLRARDSAFYRWILNIGLRRMVPFNKPHGFEVVELGAEHVKILIPYKRNNLNHIRGLHACALATISEYATGLLLLSKLGFETYRIIMQRLEMDYHYQGKTNAFAEFRLTDDWIEKSITGPLNTLESVVIKCEVKIHDEEGKQLTTGNVHWQIKKWANVKTKLSAT
jgi:acyl-coenzyme A thioesterase PaaI-like protein